MAQFSRTKFMNMVVDDFSLEESSSIQAGTKIISLNAEQGLLALENPDFANIIKESELVIADGDGIVFAAWFLQKKFLTKVSGVDLAKKLIDEKKRVAILGAEQKVIDSLEKKYKNKLVYAHNGYFEKNEEEKIVNEIANSKAELLLVGMGAPKQEKFIFNNREKFSKFISFGVGGSLDVLAGKHSRAPKFFISCHLEWLYRLILEPFRFKRIFLRVPKFFIFLLLEKFRVLEK